MRDRLIEQINKIEVIFKSMSEISMESGKLITLIETPKEGFVLGRFMANFHSSMNLLSDIIDMKYKSFYAY